jgi:predicted transcriptional regulator
MAGQFAMVPLDVFDDDRLKALDIAVYAALDSYADDRGVCWPSINSIAKRAKTSPRTVNRAILNLIAAGYIQRKQQYLEGGAGFSSSLYFLVFRGKAKNTK